MSLGGFLGADNTISVDGFADLVAAGKVRYVQVGGGGPGGGGFVPGGRFGGGRGRTFPGFGGTQAGGQSSANAVLSAVQSACAAVKDESLPASFRGSIYDCGGDAAALRARSR